MLAALAARPDLWNAKRSPHDHPGSPHADVDASGAGSTARMVTLRTISSATPIRMG